jgi:hypothetical protein
VFNLAFGVRALAKNEFDRLGAVAGYPDMIGQIRLGQRALRHLQVVRIVLDQ